MSSWLLDTAGGGAGAAAAGGGGAVGLGGAAATFAAAACAAGMADGGMSFITGVLAAGAGAAGFSGFAGATAAGAAGELEGFSETEGGFASSSAMMRRIDAKISSIEGSWTFAGCVISDSTSSTPSCARFTPSQTGFAGSGYAGRDFHHTTLTCPQINRRPTSSRGTPIPAQGTEASPARIALLPLGKVRQGNI